MGFLPENYETPQSGGKYMKMQLGPNRFRALGEAIFGNLFWTNDGQGGRKPIRRRIGEVIADHELGTDQHGQRDKVKKFLAFPVWNYAAGAVQIIEITQATIMGSLESLDASPDWGDARNYDLTITKAGTGLDTTYSVLPSPGKPLPDAITQAYAEAKINMQALFDGDDPFGADPRVEPTQRPQAAQPANPTAANGTKTMIATPKAITTKIAKGVTYFFIETNNGVFATADKQLSDRVAPIIEANEEAEFEYLDTGKGWKLVSVTESIPF